AAATDANAAADLAGSRYLRGFDAEGNTVSVHVVESLVSDAKAAPFLLLLPFTAAHSRQMLMFARRIRRAGVHAVCVDLPGHGRSGGDRGKFHILQLMRTIRTLLE